MAKLQEICEDGSCWVELRTGRIRWFPRDHWIAEMARAGLRLDAAANTRRVFAEGTHEPVVYYRDEEGKVCIPPNAEVPKGYERLEVKSLSEADKLCREMTAELKERFSFDPTAQFDQMMADKNGNLARDVIVKEMANATNYGKEMCRLMLDELDREERDRTRVNTNVFFNWRENG